MHNSTPSRHPQIAHRGNSCRSDDLLGERGGGRCCGGIYPFAGDASFLLGGALSSCVEEPRCLIHAPKESVDPAEIADMALVEALFLQRYAAATAS